MPLSPQLKGAEIIGVERKNKGASTMTTKDKTSYYQRHRERCLARANEYYQKNRLKKCADHREYYRKHQQDRLTYQSEYYKKHRNEVLQKHKKYYDANREKRLAKMQAWKYIPIEARCENCGSKENLERHHPDYSKPLEVMTLCRKCHATLHLGLMHSQ